MHKVFTAEKTCALILRKYDCLGRKDDYDDNRDVSGLSERCPQTRVYQCYNIFMIDIQTLMKK